MHNFIPTGFPPDSSRSLETKSNNSSGLENSECLCGEITSSNGFTPLASAISGVTLGARSIPPCPGLAPWLNLISIILTCGRMALS